MQQGVSSKLLLRGPKFGEMRAKRGSGGAIDLIMHLFGVNFMEAVGLLKQGQF